MDVPERFNAAAFFVDRHVADGRGGRAAFHFAGREVTYTELAERVDRAATVLASSGVEIDNRVLLVLDDTPAFAAAFWGAVKLGAVAVPVNTLMAPGEYEFFLNDSRAKVAVVEERLAEKLAQVRPRCPWLRAVLVPADLVAGAVSAAWSFDAAGRSTPEASEAEGGPRPLLGAAATCGEDVMYWGYTSGSTGRPKAAVHSHQDFVAAAELVGAGVFGIGADDRIFSASKLYFAFGLGNTLYFPALVGAASVLVPERITPELAFEVIAAERPTIFFAVPTLYARMLQVPDAERVLDLSSLRYCVSSGETLPTAIFDAWADRFGLELVEVVGSTEALHDFIANRPGKARRGAAGQVIPGFEAKLVDDTGQPVPLATVGHLLVKGPTTSVSYWNRLEGTRTTMLGEWLRTGDMFSQDADGFFTFAGRADDMLKVGGVWVSPTEVEGRLVEHPAVLEAAVVGRADETGLTKVHASVVLKDMRLAGERLADELRRFVKERMATSRTPHWIEFVPELPKTATGKVQRFRLRSEH